MKSYLQIVLFIIFILSISCQYSKHVPDCASCCNALSFKLNNNNIHDILQNLRNYTFFKIFKVNINEKCTFWPDNSMCAKPACSVFDCTDEEIPAAWKMEQSYPVNRDLSSLSFTNWDEKDDSWIPQSVFWGSQPSYINLQKNPESYTAFKGVEARKVWDAIYSENCFYKGDPRDVNSMCYEERVFYRIISGLQAEIGAHISWLYSNEEGKIAPSTAVFKEKLGDYPERIDNIFFVFVFLSRAVNKAAHILRNFDYSGDPSETIHILNGISSLLSSDTIQQCSPTQSFDESLLFKDPELSPFKNEFKKNFRNISRILDCVGCEKCRLHGKLQILGIGTALKILFAPDVNKLRLQRNEVIALINTIGKFSHAIYIIDQMQTMITRREYIFYLLYSSAGVFALFILYVIYQRCGRRRTKVE